MFSMQRKRRWNNIAILTFGLLFVAGAFLCGAGSFLQKGERAYWSEVPHVSDAQALSQHAEGTDVVLTGFIAFDAVTSPQGLAVQECWRMRIKRGAKEERYGVEELDPRCTLKPFFMLTTSEGDVMVQSDEAGFLLARTLRKRESNISRVRYVGFAPGDKLTVMGEVVSAPDETLQVKAHYLCGGERTACLDVLQRTGWLWLGLTGLSFTIGAVLVILGAMRLFRHSPA